jgi:hypothetical protein
LAIQSHSSKLFHLPHQDCCLIFVYVCRFRVSVQVWFLNISDKGRTFSWDSPKLVLKLDDH